MGRPGIVLNASQETCRNSHPVPLRGHWSNGSSVVVIDTVQPTRGSRPAPPRERAFRCACLPITMRYFRSPKQTPVLSLPRNRSKAASIGGLILCLASTVSLPLAARAEPPARVVSLNLCTDQLAMMIAAPGQLYSVSHIALDPRASAMADEAGSYRINHGLAEEIYLMRPDLVLTGSHTRRVTARMLERLGIPVAVFEPATSLDDVRENIVRIGEILGERQRAKRLLDDFDRRLDRIRSTDAGGKRAAIYSANGYTSGRDTLAGRILTAAGLTNIAAEAGYSGGGTMPLESLALADPDLVVTSHPYPGSSRSEEILQHPVVKHLRTVSRHAAMSDHDWVCGTPYVLRAIARLSTVVPEP